jgi:hypothetical protein
LVKHKAGWRYKREDRLGAQKILLESAINYGLRDGPDPFAGIQISTPTPTKSSKQKQSPRAWEPRLRRLAGHLHNAVAARIRSYRWLTGGASSRAIGSKGPAHAQREHIDMHQHSR